MNTIIVKADKKITKALIAIFEAFGVAFEIKKNEKSEESPYDPKFVEKILDRSKSAKKGSTVVYTEKLKKELFQS